MLLNSPWEQYATPVANLTKYLSELILHCTQRINRAGGYLREAFIPKNRYRIGILQMYYFTCRIPNNCGMVSNRPQCSKKDYLAIYGKPDGRGHPELSPICGYGYSTPIVMEGNVAYVVYHTDGFNDGDYGEEGFIATFYAKGNCSAYIIIMLVNSTHKSDESKLQTFLSKKSASLK